MDGRRYTNSTSNRETIEMRPQCDKPKSKPQPFSLPRHNPEVSYADGEGNQHKTTNDRLPAFKLHANHHVTVPCPPGKDVANDKAFVVQDLPPEPIPSTTPEEFQSSEDASNHVERNGQATPPSAVKFVRPRDNVICVVHRDKQYRLNNSNKRFLLGLPRATAYLILNVRGGGETFTLRCSSEEELPNVDATEGAVVLVRKHFHWNANKPGYVVYSLDLQRFSGDCQYPLPKKKAEDDIIGYRTNTQSFVFTMFHEGKEYAVKKTVYRPEVVSVHSQLCHPNIVNLEAVLIGPEHECLKNQFYAYYFMPKMDVNLKKVLSSNQDGCLEYYKGKEQWGLVLPNVRHILKCVLEAMNYMGLQGVVLRSIKADNVLINMACPCVGNDVLLCRCCCCCQTFDVKLSLSSSMITGYDFLYADGTDIRLFGQFLLDVLKGKSAQGYEDPQGICYTNYLLSELERCYGDTPELCDLVHKCFQVGVVLTLKDLLQLNFFN